MPCDLAKSSLLKGFFLAATIKSSSVNGVPEIAESAPSLLDFASSTYCWLILKSVGLKLVGGLTLFAVVKYDLYCSTADGGITSSVVSTAKTWSLYTIPEGIIVWYLLVPGVTNLSGLVFVSVPTEGDSCTS